MEHCSYTLSPGGRVEHSSTVSPRSLPTLVQSVPTAPSAAGASYGVPIPSFCQLRSGRSATAQLPHMLRMWLVLQMAPGACWAVCQQLYASRKSDDTLFADATFIMAGYQAPATWQKKWKWGVVLGISCLAGQVIPLLLTLDVP